MGSVRCLPGRSAGSSKCPGSAGKPATRAPMQHKNAGIAPRKWSEEGWRDQNTRGISPAEHFDAHKRNLPSFWAGAAVSGGTALLAVAGRLCPYRGRNTRGLEASMCVDIAEVVFLVCAGPHSIAGACTADRLTALPRSAAGAANSRQPHHKRPRSLPHGTPELGPAPVRRPRTHTCAVDMRAEVVHTGVHDRRGR